MWSMAWPTVWIFFCGVIGDIDVELLFEFHHQFHGIQGIGPQIVDE